MMKMAHFLLHKKIEKLPAAQLCISDRKTILEGLLCLKDQVPSGLIPSCREGKSNREEEAAEKITFQRYHSEMRVGKVGHLENCSEI